MRREQHTYRSSQIHQHGWGIHVCEGRGGIEHLKKSRQAVLYTNIQRGSINIEQYTPTHKQSYTLKYKKLHLHTTPTYNGRAVEQCNAFTNANSCNWAKTTVSHTVKHHRFGGGGGGGGEGGKEQLPS